jgi:hypothetical protein
MSSRRPLPAGQILVPVEREELDEPIRLLLRAHDMNGERALGKLAFIRGEGTTGRSIAKLPRELRNSIYAKMLAESVVPEMLRKTMPYGHTRDLQGVIRSGVLKETYAKTMDWVRTSWALVNFLVEGVYYPLEGVLAGSMEESGHWLVREDDNVTWNNVDSPALDNPDNRNIWADSADPFKNYDFFSMDEQNVYIRFLMWPRDQYVTERPDMSDQQATLYYAASTGRRLIGSSGPNDNARVAAEMVDLSGGAGSNFASRLRALGGYDGNVPSPSPSQLFAALLDTQRLNDEGLRLEFADGIKVGPSNDAAQTALVLTGVTAELAPVAGVTTADLDPAYAFHIVVPFA